MAHKGANFETHLNTEYKTHAFQPWIKNSILFGQSPFGREKKKEDKNHHTHTKKKNTTTKTQHTTTHTNHTPLSFSNQNNLPSQHFPYDFILVSFPIFPPPSPPQTPVQLSDKLRPEFLNTGTCISQVSYNKLQQPQTHLLHQTEMAIWAHQVRRTSYSKFTDPMALRGLTSRTQQFPFPPADPIFFSWEGPALQIRGFNVK